MATGKTAVGRELARLLDRPFIDLDQEVERLSGREVAELFRTGGEPAFRALEREVVADAARLSGAVIACGGGAPLDRESFGQLAEGALRFWLDCPHEEVQRRLHLSPRPLIPDPEAGDLVAALMESRRPAYAFWAERVETGGRSVADVAREIGAACPQNAPARIEVRGDVGAHEVIIGRGSLARLEAELGRVSPTATSMLVAHDSHVAQWADRLVQGVGRLDCALVPLPRGEASKQLTVVAGLWEELLRRGWDRQSPLVALGGGAVLDAAGFAAATFARGVPLVNVPTTVLAMADASVGGKVAIDHGGGKNTVGSFYYPRLVVMDPDTLSTLPPEVARQGLAEVVKVAALASPMLLRQLASWPLDSQGLPARPEWLIEQAVRIKAAFVAADPRDTGMRQALNLGHTFAHAVEAASGYNVSHGDAVSIGLLAAARLGEALGEPAAELANQQRAALDHLGLPQTAPRLSQERLRRALGADKKRRRGRLYFVIRSAGGTQLAEGVEPGQALAALYPSAQDTEVDCA